MLTAAAEQPEEVLSSGVEPPGAPVLEEQTQKGPALEAVTTPTATESTEAEATASKKPAKKVTAKRKSTKKAVTKKAGKKPPGSRSH